MIQSCYSSLQMHFFLQSLCTKFIKKNFHCIALLAIIIIHFISQLSLKTILSYGEEKG